MRDEFAEVCTRNKEQARKSNTTEKIQTHNLGGCIITKSLLELNWNLIVIEKFLLIQMRERNIDRFLLGKGE